MMTYNPLAEEDPADNWVCVDGKQTAMAPSTVPAPLHEHGWLVHMFSCPLAQGDTAWESSNADSIDIASNSPAVLHTVLDCNPDSLEAQNGQDCDSARARTSGCTERVPRAIV